MRFTAMLVVLCAVIAIVAGCGSSNSSTSATTTPSGGATASTTPSSASASTSTSATATSFANVPNCQALGGLGAKYAQALSAATSGGKYDLKSVAVAYQNLANGAPSEIRADLQLTSQAFTSFAAAFTKIGYKPGQVPTPAQVAGVNTAAQVLSQPSFRSAEQRISVWAHKNCH
jgi:hypothetical protein